MPLIGKRLKGKNLSTVTVTGEWPGAKTERTYKAKKRRIIFWVPAVPLTKLRLSPASPAKNCDWRSPRFLLPVIRQARLRLYKAARFANRVPEFPFYLEDAHRVFRTRRSDFLIRPPRGRDQFPLKSRAPALLFSRWRLIFAWAAG